MARSGPQRDWAILKASLDALTQEDRPISENLDRLFDISLARRLATITDTLVPQLGDRVAAGPFAGMVYPLETAEGCIIPKLLGCYEKELQPALSQFSSGHPDAVLNIGCAEGYYAVGLARALPAVKVYAWDIAPDAREKTARNAAANGVGDRITIAADFDPAALGDYTGGISLIICDIEGAEFEYLDPGQYPALLAFDMIVEVHPDNNRTVEELAGRFSATHRVGIVYPKPRNPTAHDLLKGLNPLDQSLALFERLESTPWIICHAARD